MKRCIILVLLLACSGCDRQDADILTRVGWRISTKVQSLIPDRSPFGNTWSTDTSLESRVRARLASDKFLAPLNIEVIAATGGVCLRGTIADEVLKQRALEMADATIGVENVVDELVVP